MLTLFIALAAFLIPLLWWADQQWRIKGIPGPSGAFLLESIFELGGNCCKTWINWKKTYGPVFQIRVLNKRIVILNDKESTVECFSKAEASGRLGFPAVKEVNTKFGAGVAGRTGKHLEEIRQFFLRSFKEFGMTEEFLEERIRPDIEALLEEWALKKGAFFPLRGAFNGFVVNSVCDLLLSARFDPEEILF